MKERDEVKQTLQDVNIVEPLCERDAFFGCKTNATTLYKKLEEDERSNMWFLPRFTPPCIYMLNTP